MLNLEERHRETSSFLTEPQVYGKEAEKEHIANLLLQGGDEVSVCCIIGMGGLGKTTLAQLVYNDDKIASLFQLKCWVCVSDHFVLKTVLKSIIETTSETKCDVEDLDLLQRRVQGILSGKKFLIVLDDVWNEDQTKWNKLKSMLTCGGTGSSIILTTRYTLVASITSTLPVWRLSILSEENCWSLFKHYAFKDGNEKQHPNLDVIGKEIVKKCGGVPLAAKALGGLLRFKKTEKDWLFVRDSALWDLPQDKEGAILPSLRLSYNHLPSHLKQCFSYCSIFPKDYEMKKEVLIHLWMANGFIQPKGNMGLEDIGNEIFNELLWRSFFQEVKNDRFSNIVRCKMHDLVHDLASSITVNECTVVDVNKDQDVLNHSTRHLLLKTEELVSVTCKVKLYLSKSGSLLRTFLQTHDFGWWPVHDIEGLSFSHLKSLRVLDLSETKMETLHVSIGNLKHLRYLDLSYGSNLKSLPNEICNLRNLQVLKLDYCKGLGVLPENMRKMTNLIHLGLTRCDKLRQMPVGMGSLSCLQTLNLFVITPKSGCGISELQGLDYLTGDLEIRGLQHVTSLKDAWNANLMRKKNLQRLILSWKKKYYNGNLGEEEVGEGLQPHSNIKKLQIQCYNGLKLPHWLSYSCVPNLVEICLVDCRRCEPLPPLGQLPHLQIHLIPL